jgi:hypothetical protein
LAVARAAPDFGAHCAAFIVASNLILRPLVRAINRQPVDSTEGEFAYVVSIVRRASPGTIATGAGTRDHARRPFRRTR